MATDWARYMYQYKDVYDEYSDGGKWTWDRGRQANAYMRNDGTPLLAETAAEYAQNHYRAHGKRAGRKIHEKSGVDYAAKLREREAAGSGGNSGGNSGTQQEQNPLNRELVDLVKMLSDLATARAGNTNSTSTSTSTQSSEAASQAVSAAQTLLTNFNIEEAKKKKSFLTPIGA